MLPAERVCLQNKSYGEILMKFSGNVKMAQGIDHSSLVEIRIISWITKFSFHS